MSPGSPSIVNYLYDIDTEEAVCLGRVVVVIDDLSLEPPTISDALPKKVIIDFNDQLHAFPRR